LAICPVSANQLQRHRKTKIALLRIILSGNPKFFLGTDSAPHPTATKRGRNIEKVRQGWRFYTALCYTNDIGYSGRGDHPRK